MLFGPPLRRGFSEYHLRQVRHRHRYLRSAKNHAVATLRLLGQAPELGADPDVNVCRRSRIAVKRYCVASDEHILNVAVVQGQ